jgi:hypothetical protein
MKNFLFPWGKKGKALHGLYKKEDALQHTTATHNHSGRYRKQKNCS